MRSFFSFCFLIVALGLGMTAVAQSDPAAPVTPAAPAAATPAAPASATTATPTAETAPVPAAETPASTAAPATPAPAATQAAPLTQSDVSAERIFQQEAKL